ncbi:MAG: hypothetical protein EBY38_05575 [Flavobacteriaceae bacterium]|nr:hypothetical protein [Flavobacteriaceae bacterium]
MTEYVRVIERVELLNSYVLEVPSDMTREDFVDELVSSGMVDDSSVVRTVYENDVAESYLIEIIEHLPEKMTEGANTTWQLYETDGERLYEYDK